MPLITIDTTTKDADKSLRDGMAQAAMLGYMLAAGVQMTAAETATKAYAMADAMMSQRTKTT